MSAIVTKVLADQSFGQRLFAMIASIYAIATFVDPQTLQRSEHPGYENIARALEVLGLSPVAAWIRDPLFSSRHGSEAAEAVIWVVLVASLLGMVAVFRRSAYNIAPQASFGCLMTLTLLNDLGVLRSWSTGALLVGVAVLAALFTRFADSESPDAWFAVGVSMIVSPIFAAVFAPVRVLAWILQEPGRDLRTVQIETGHAPVHVKLVD